MDRWKGEGTKDSFKDVFYENLQKTGHFRKAYEMTEDEHEDVFHKRKYSGVQSFKVQLSKKNKQ